MTEWIPVETSLPEESGSYNILFNNKEPHVSYFNFITNEWSIGEDYHRVTHWAPLPEMPKKKRWMPKLMDEFYFINSDATIGRKDYPTYMHWSSSNCNCLTRSFLGVYKTKEEAELIRDKIKKFVESEIGEA